MNHSIKSAGEAAVSSIRHADHCDYRQVPAAEHGDYCLSLLGCGISTRTADGRDAEIAVQLASPLVDGKPGDPVVQLAIMLPDSGNVTLDLPSGLEIVADLAAAERTRLAVRR